MAFFAIALNLFTRQKFMGESMRSRESWAFVFLCLFGINPLLGAQEKKSNEQITSELLMKSHPVLLQWLETFESNGWAEYEIAGQSESALDDSGEMWVRQIFQSSFNSPTVQRHTTLWKGSANKNDIAGGTWLQFPDRIVDWQNASSVGSTVCIRPNSSPHLIRDGRAIDPRLVALLGTAGIPSPPQFRGAAFIIGKECRDVPSNNDGLRTVIMIPIVQIRELQNSYIRTEATFDESKGMVPVRVRKFQMWEGSSPEGYLTEEVNSEYVHVQDQWVPFSVKIVKFSPERDGPKFKCDLGIKWKSVGEELDQSVFDVNNFGASKGKTIVDFRTSDKGITIARIGNCRPDGSPLPPDDPIAKLLSEKPTGYSSRVKTIIAVNAILLGSLTFLFFKRRRQQQS